MYQETDLRKLYERLNAQHPAYAAELSGSRLTLSRLYGRVDIRPEGARLYVNDTLYDQFTSEDVDDLDDLYELIELFFLDLQQIGMQTGNAVYISAQKQAAQRGTRVLLIGAFLVAACMIAVLLTGCRWWLPPVLLIPIASLVPLVWARRSAFRAHWVCPVCGQALPLEGKRLSLKMAYVPQCPHCGHVLEQPPEMASIHQEGDAPSTPFESAQDLPAPGKAWPSRLAGSLTLAISLALFPLLFVSDEPLDAAGVATAVVMLLFMIAVGLALLLRRPPKRLDTQQPIVVLRERGVVSFLGFVQWMLASVLMFSAIIVADTPPFDAAVTLVCALLGVPFLLLGVWMLLAARNRALFVFEDRSMLYVSSWGRVRRIAAGQVTSVRLTANRSLHLLDSAGRKLISVEANMRGIPEFAAWIEHAHLHAALTPAMEKQTANQPDRVVQWREADRLPLHDHLRAVRTCMILSTLLLAVGAIAPFPLYLFADVKFRAVMALSAIAPIPYWLCCIAFAPVLIFGDRPAQATPEWNAMHVKAPFISALLLQLIGLWQINSLWSHWIMQPANSWIWLGQSAFLGILLAATLIPRIIKPCRVEGGVMMGLSAFMFAFVLTYCANAALSTSTRHYPAVIVDSHAGNPEKEDDDSSLTVLLDDGSETTLYVFDEIFQQAMDGKAMDVCHWESPLGLDLLKVHPHQ